MNQEKSLKMRNMSIGKLIASMSIPAMFSMLIQALYNVVDSVYISRVVIENVKSEDLITALGYAFALQIIILAFSLGIGVGSNVLVARKLGERKPQEASNIARTGIILALVAGLIFFVLSFFIVEPYMKMMSNSETIIKYGTQYLKIVMMFSIFSIIEVSLNKILQGMGRMVIPMFTQLIGAITNIILDPIMIFGLFGFPALGVRGAAIATVIGQFVAMLFVIIYIISHKFEIHLGLKNFKIKLDYVVEIFKVGLPAFAMNALGALTNIFINQILIYIDPSETGNFVLTTYFKLQSFIFMPVFGLNQGGMPILSYNYGARLKARYQEALKKIIISSFTIMVIGLIIFQLIPNYLIGFFNPTDQTSLNLGVTALRIISFSFIPASASIIITMAYQSIGYGHTALYMSVLRQAILLLPFSYIIGMIGGIKWIWFSYPLSEVIVALIFTPILYKVVKKVFDKNLNEEEKFKTV